MSTDPSPLPSRVLNACNWLMASGFVPCGPLYCSQFTVGPTTEEDTADETDPTATAKATVVNTSVEQAPPANLGLPARPERAILSAVACVDHDDFWLTATGGYHSIPTRFKLHHQLFERLQGDGVQDDAPPPDSPSDDPCSIEHWPLTKARHRTELLTLESAHRLLPIPAYDPQQRWYNQQAHRPQASSMLYTTISH
ncbi:hypothetical protein PISMIDRAFT_17974 [Pisolithus microcarpus 441]|uniref:Uncharacterized protein n=1 Tax=Pisolithus microcarpus 441 TaxID=765257 RepID=A0A0C9XMA0_9AGAM|nr:hypothetical protein BKA83DRAFT_17974 [Pisolithus microcarpus]KIK13470.1 hypothetical protein PISMIDRAFT_17974 [Pisolithus microcarpus 441]